MLHYVLLIHRISGLPIFDMKVSSTFFDISSDLLSGLLSALQSFSKYLKIGELSTFDAHNYKAVIKNTENLQVILIIDRTDPDDDWKEIAEKIAEYFESKYDFSNWIGEIKKVPEFETYLEELIQRYSWNIIEIPEEQIREEELTGFLIYELDKRNVYKCDIDAEYTYADLIKRSESLLKDANDARIEQRRHILYFMKKGNRRVILEFPLNVSQFDFKRYAKMFSFLAEHLFDTLKLKEKLRRPAVSALGEKIVDEIERYGSMRLLDILMGAPKPLSVIDGFRKAWVRDLLTIGGELD